MIKSVEGFEIYYCIKDWESTGQYDTSIKDYLSGNFYYLKELYGYDSFKIFSALDIGLFCGYIGKLYLKEYFITLSEYRNMQIQNILN